MTPTTLGPQSTEELKRLHNLSRSPKQEKAEKRLHNPSFVVGSAMLSPHWGGNKQGCKTLTVLGS